MNLPQLYSFLVYIIPIATALGWVARTYFKAKRGLIRWSSTLMNNHAAHLQASADQMNDSLKDISKTNQDMSETLRGIQNDHKEFQREVISTQHEIVTGIEVLRERG
jgi:hypothetical protein